MRAGSLLRVLTYALLAASIGYGAKELVVVAKAAKAVIPAAAPAHAEMYDAASSGGQLFHGQGGPDRAAAPGGAVLIDAHGERLEIAPAPTADRRADGLVKAVAKAGAGAAAVLPSLDDPTADLAARKRRAQLILAASTAGAFALVVWARRWRPS